MKEIKKVKHEIKTVKEAIEMQHHKCANREHIYARQPKRREEDKEVLRIYEKRLMELKERKKHL